MSKAGKRLIGAAKEALEVAKGQREPINLFIPPDIDVKAIRSVVGGTQAQFANDFGFSLDQIRSWEQERNRPIGSDRAYLLLIRDHPDEIRRLLREAVTRSRQENAA